MSVLYESAKACKKQCTVIGKKLSLVHPDMCRHIRAKDVLM